MTVTRDFIGFIMSALAKKLGWCFCCSIVNTEGKALPLSLVWVRNVRLNLHEVESDA